jgi:hypothetical protein
MMLLMLAAALALTAAADANQRTSPPTTTSAKAGPPAARPKPKADPVICNWEVITGSNFTRRVCMTQDQWVEMTRQSQDFDRTLEAQGGLAGLPPSNQSSGSRTR